MVQALIKTERIGERVAEDGQLVVDKCHHASSVSFERILGEAHAPSEKHIEAKLCNILKFAFRSDPFLD